VQCIQRGRKGKNEVGAGDCELREAAVYAVTSEGWRVAEVLKMMLAVPALTVCSTEPGDSYTGSEWQLGRCACDDLTDDLVAGNQVLPLRRQLSFYDVQVCAANSASQHSQKNLPTAGLRLWHVLYVQRTRQKLNRRSEHCGFQFVTPFREECRRTSTLSRHQ
jgi:hypothetical protein